MAAHAFLSASGVSRLQRSHTMPIMQTLLDARRTSTTPGPGLGRATSTVGLHPEGRLERAQLALRILSGLVGAARTSEWGSLHLSRPVPPPLP